MNEVRRYDVQIYQDGFWDDVESPTGKWVHASDYDALAARVQAVEKALKQTKANFEQCEREMYLEQDKLEQQLADLTRERDEIAARWKHDFELRCDEEEKNEQLNQQLAASQARVRELEDWQKIVLGSGTDHETVIRMAAIEYTKTAVQCWREKVQELQATLAAREREVDAIKADAWDQKQKVLKTLDTACQDAARLREAAQNLTCEVCKLDMQRALKGA